MIEIRATARQPKTEAHFNKLTLKLWEWPEGRILELSTKAGSNAGPMTSAMLQDLVWSKTLSMSHDQRSKATGLESVTQYPAR